MKNIQKGIYIMGLMVVLAFAGVANTQAAPQRGKAVAITHEGVADFGKGTAGLKIQGNKGQSLLGKEFHIYQLFGSQNAAGKESIHYTFHPECEDALKTVVGKKLSRPKDSVTEYMVIDYIQTLNNNEVEGSDAEQNPEGRYSTFRYFIEELRDEMKKQGTTGDTVRVTSVKEDNSIAIKGLADGYYVIDEVSYVEGTHTAASLCMVNTANPEAEIRIKSDYPVVTKKIREDDNQETIGDEGWNDIGDFEIGQTVPYRFSSKIPNMNGYDSYYFAWHDVMNQALTFQADTVSVRIWDKDLEKEYVLKPSEFKTVLNPGNGETFQVQIQDLKAIVDREFDRINETSENIYGQEIILMYDAVLNDLAAEECGRPGFENDVKLEFSNNPDSDGKGETGETPWDTVVCFTYKLNGLKLNNHDKVLEGAKFRLYSDEACEEEVYVKKTERGYYVINRDSVGGTDHTGGHIPKEAVEMVSDEKGVFTVFGLDGGTYWLKETKAPMGYRPLLDPIRVKVRPTYIQNRNSYVKGEGATDKVLKELEYEVYIKEFLDGIFGEETIKLERNIEAGEGNLTVVNEVGTKLPATGGYVMAPILAGGLLLVILAVRKQRRS